MSLSFLRIYSSLFWQLLTLLHQIATKKTSFLNRHIYSLFLQKDREKVQSTRTVRAIHQQIANRAAVGFWRTHRGRSSNIPRERVIIASIPIRLNGSCTTGACSPEVCNLDVAIFALQIHTFDALLLLAIHEAFTSSSQTLIHWMR